MTQTKTIANIAAFYTLVGCLGVFLAFHPTLLSQFAKAQADTGDTRFVNYVLEHTFQSVFHPDRVGNLWSPRFFFPFENTLALSENMLGAAPLYWLARAFFTPDLAYQCWTIACVVLCYVCFAIFLRSFKVSHVLSAFGGFIFAFGLVRIGRLFHSQLLPQFFTPLALLFIWKFLRQPTPNRLRLALACIFLQVAAGIYLGWFLLVSLLIFVPLLLWFDRASLKNTVEFVQQHWRSTLTTFAVWFGALLMLLSPYLKMSKLLGARPFAELEVMLPRLTSWIYPFPNTLWYPSLSPLSKNLPFPHEHHIFMGFTVYVLVGFALYIAIAKPKVLGERAGFVKASLATALIIVGLSLYLAPGVSLWSIIYNTIPGASAIRAVSRIALFVECFLLTAAVLSLDSWLKRSPIKPRIATAIVLVIFGISISENFISIPLAFEKKPILQTEAEPGELMRQGCNLAYVNLT
ncbi:hypothetical protein IQ250_19875, partial [Pseudanabaenaceae cyanobacterium LEGE 13415]|nr:hypothetical protein [Pseudanabaenaceae cyanobacterium LEGE 13415]